MTRLAASTADGDPDMIARAAAVLLLTLRGTPFLYYGEELGMGDVDIPPEECVDPPAFRFGPDFAWWDRSRCRTPMPWTSGPGAGFTTGRPWLRLGPDVDTRNVERQVSDPGSILATYRALIALRASTPALQVGSLRLRPEAVDDLVAFTRETDGQTVLVVVNVGRSGATWRLAGKPEASSWRLLFGTARSGAVDASIPAGTTLVVGPDEGLIFEALP